VLIIIIIIIIIISFMQSIYTYIPGTNCVCMEYSIAAILLFLFMVHITLFTVLNLLHFYISTFRSMCLVPNMAVFCSSLTSWIPGALLLLLLLLLCCDLDKMNHTKLTVVLCKEKQYFDRHEIAENEHKGRK
jgi:hypothetical protein